MKQDSVSSMKVSHGDNDLLGIASAELRKILSMPELAAFDGEIHA